jgi:hypothetical protein
VLISLWQVRIREFQSRGKTQIGLSIAAVVISEEPLDLQSTRSPTSMADGARGGCPVMHGGEISIAAEPSVADETQPSVASPSAVLSVVSDSAAPLLQRYDSDARSGGDDDMMSKSSESSKTMDTHQVCSSVWVANGRV